LKKQFILAGILACCGMAASASTYTLTGDVDGRVRNVDAAAFTDASVNEVYLGTSGFRTNTILEFDLSFLAVGETIDSITISMTGIASTNTLFVNGYAGNGVLETSDALQSANSLGLFAVSAGSNGPFSLSTGFVDSLLLANEDYLGLNIGITSAQSFGSASDFSVTFETSISAVPLPAAGLLLMGALGGLGLMRRKRKTT